MESASSPPPVDPGAAREALASADAARRDLMGGVTYPRAYLPLVAGYGAGVPLLGAVGAQSTPSDWVSGLLLLGGLVGIGAAGWSLRVFEAANGLRITGLRSGRRLTAWYVAFVVTLMAAVALLVNTTDAWWAALVAAPVGAAGALTYAKAWLADWQRRAR